ncbi:MAG: hypothetical protein JRF36_06430 [Deltaproteobacteria bacterium]|jgi:hypothetical protein|nr:hypothetical protein [Deltaproteobacteria bacterium]
MNFRNHVAIAVILILMILLQFACQKGVPREALMFTPESLADRQLQTRVFETDNEGKLLEASAGVLQDLGFTIDESEVRCGVIVCSKDRDVTEIYDVGLSIIASIFFVDYEYATRQKVLASLVTRPLGEKKIAVRITFQHLVWDTQKDLIKNERINDPYIYQKFFSKLSKSVFLTAQEI